MDVFNHQTQVSDNWSSCQVGSLEMLEVVVSEDSPSMMTMRLRKPRKLGDSVVS